MITVVLSGTARILSSRCARSAGKQLKPHVQFIPHGAPGSYDSSIIYAAMPMRNPTNATETWIYYDGVRVTERARFIPLSAPHACLAVSQGIGPHSGPHREDTLNLAIGHSDAFAGLHHDSSGSAWLRLTNLPVEAQMTLRSCAVLAQLDAGATLTSTMPGGERSAPTQATASMHSPRWMEIQVQPQAGEGGQSSEVELELAGSGTLFALRC
jgi:hypothetical protein